MENKLEKYNEYLLTFEKKINERSTDVVFLELRKDLLLKNKYVLSKEIPLPIKSEYFVSGVRNNEFEDSINSEEILISIAFVIGCSETNFKYRNDYIELLKKFGIEIENFLMYIALKYIKEKEYIDSIIILRTVDLISNNHLDIRYNIATSFRELAISLSDKESKDYILYYNLSYFEFLNISNNYPEFYYSRYYLGFFYYNEGDLAKALIEWDLAYKNIKDEDKKNELIKMINIIHEKQIFEEGKRDIEEGDALQGLKKIIPLVQSHDDWSEAKYFVALGYRKIGNYKKAELLLKELLEEEDFSEIYNELGLCSFYMGDNITAIANFNIAVKLKEDEPGYLCNLAIAYYNEGEIKKSKELIDKAYNIKPDDELTYKCKLWSENI